MPFREDRQTVDLIFALEQLIEKSWKFDKDRFIAFFDCEKAFESIT